MLDLDEAMAEVVARATQPALAAIKLAWWRERLEELDPGGVPAEPRLQAAARELLPRGLSGAALSALEEPWALLVAEDPEAGLPRAIALRGERLFALGARLLGVAMNDRLEQAGRCFAAADLGRRGFRASEPPDLTLARVPRGARPLTMLAALALRDMNRGGAPYEPEATPGRAWTLWRHRLTGRL